MSEVPRRIDPARRLELPHEELDQRGLSAAVGTDDADPIAAHDAGREIRDHGSVAEIERTRRCASNTSFPDGAASCALRSICPSRSRRSRRSDAQLLERADPAFVASAARFDTLADPRLFLSEFLVEQGRMLGLDVERGALLEHVVVVAAGPAREVAAIELHDARSRDAE